MASARNSSKIALFVLVAVMGFIPPAAAQQEVQIMVNGPWAYVPTPTPTPPLPSPTPTPAIVIATPQIPHHGDVQIFPGEDADDFASVGSNMEIAIHQNKPGKYTLVIDGLADCDPLPSPLPAPTPHAYPLTNVSVDNVLQGNIKGFSLLLPKPCFYSSYLESRSKLDLTSTANVDPKGYTTWMVLHYKAKPGVTPTASIQEIANSSVTFQSNDPSSDPPAISIVMGADSQNETNRRCDSLSGQSVQLEASLFGTTLHYQFPTLRKSGQQTEDYKPDCADNFASLTQDKLKMVLHDIQVIESFLKDRSTNSTKSQAAFKELNLLVLSLNPPANVRAELQNVQGQMFSSQAAKNGALSQTKLYVVAMAAGAGDCRGAQLNVDGTIP